MDGIWHGTLNTFRQLLLNILRDNGRLHSVLCMTSYNLRVNICRSIVGLGTMISTERQPFGIHLTLFPSTPAIWPGALPYTRVSQSTMKQLLCNTHLPYFPFCPEALPAGLCLGYQRQLCEILVGLTRRQLRYL